MPEIDWKALWDRAIAGFALGPHSLHGPSHWRRVENNVIRLAGSNGADLLVCRLFAVLHDSKRHNEYDDPEHGQRAADWAAELHGREFHLSTTAFEQLRYACIWHDRGHTSDDPTIGACWDADRLDLPRVGIEPLARYMSTKLGRDLIGADASSRINRTSQ